MDNLLIKIIVDKLGITEFDGNTTLGELGVDSLDRIELVMEIEKHYRISVSDDEIFALDESVTLDKLQVLINKKKEDGE